MSLPTAIGLTWGSFALNTNKYKPGNYTVNAYTNWMQNFGETHFFKKEIKVVGLTNEPIASSKKPRDIDIQFLPEGGKFMADLPQRMAFKAIDENGKGIIIKGKIVDTKNASVADFESNPLGMGYVTLIPKINEAYEAVVKYGDLVKTVTLPKVQQNGTLLQVMNKYKKDSIKVTAYTNRLSDQEFTIIGQAKGVVCFTSKIRFNTPIKFLYIPKTAFPTGVGQILLKAGKNTLNERSFFINHKDELSLNLHIDSVSYGLRDSIPIEMQVLNKDRMPIAGSFSMAITDNNQVPKDSANDASILSYFLLSSDLKGEIERPGHYFHQIDEQKHNDLDALMLTQAWVSYDWEDGKKPIFKVEKEFALKGRVFGLLNQTVPNAKMTMFGKNKGMVMLHTVANEKGEFTFNDLPVMDNASFVIQAKNTKDKKGSLTIEVEEFKAPKVNVLPRKEVFTNILLDSITKNFIAVKKEEAKFTFNEGILLNEVNIIGKRVIKNSKNLNGPGKADQTITEEELNKVSKKTLLDLLKEKVKDFDLKIGTGIFVRNQALKLIIDGVNVDFFFDYTETLPYPREYYNFIRSYIDNYQAEDIAGLEIMTSYGNKGRYVTEFATIYDLDKLTFLEVTTRTGFGPFVKKIPNLYLFKPINYGSTPTFYHPRYTAINKTDKKPDFRSTLYWNPNIVTDEKGQAQISFFSSDKKGSYTVWVEGSDMQGNFGFTTHQLIIK